MPFIPRQQGPSAEGPIYFARVQSPPNDGSWIPSTSVLDNFNRTAENPISDGGLWYSGGGPNGLALAQTNGTQALSTGGDGTYTGATWAGSTTLPIEIYCDISALPTSNQYVQLTWYTTLTGPGNGYYVVMQPGQWGMGYVAGGATGPVVGGALTWGAGDSIGMTIDINFNIKMLRKPFGGVWTQIGGWTDVTPPFGSVAYPGWFTSSSSTRLDNFGGTRGVVTFSSNLSATQGSSTSISRSTNKTFSLLTPVQQNLITDPSFEYDTVGVQPTNTALFGSSAATAVVSNAWSSSGSRSLLFNCPSVTAGDFPGVRLGSTNPFPIVGGLTYDLQAVINVITNTTTETIRLDLEWYDSGKNYISEFIVATTSSSLGVFSISGPVTVPANAAYAAVQIYGHSVSGGTALSFYVDSVLLAPVAVAPTYNDGDSAGWVWSGTPGQSASRLSSVSVSKSVLATKSMSQGQTASLFRSINVFRSMTVVSVTVVLRQNAHTASITQAKATTLIRSVGINKAPPQAQSVVINTTTQHPRIISITQGQGVTINTTTQHPRTISITQGQAVVVQRSVSKIPSITQGQATALVKSVAHSLSLINGSATSIVRTTNATRSATQSQSTTIIRTNGKALLITQGQSATIIRGINKGETLTQGQAVSLLRQNAKTLSISRTSAATVSRQNGIIRSVAQGQNVVVSTLHANAKVLSITQAQATTIQRTTNAIRSITQGQTTTIIAAVSHVKILSITQSSTTTVLRQTGHIALITQAKNLSLIRSVGINKAPPQSQTTTVAKTIGISRLIGQGQTASIIRQAGKKVAISQAQTAFIARQESLVHSVVQSQAVTIIRQVGKVLIATQAQSVVVQHGQAFTKLFTITQGQLASLQRITNLTRTAVQPKNTTISRVEAKILSLAQSQNVIPGHQIIRSVVITQPQSASLRRSIGVAKTTSQNQAIFVSRVINKNEFIAQGQSVVISTGSSFIRVFTITQGQSVVANRSNLKTLSLGQNQLAVLVRNAPKIIRLTQTQTVIISRGLAHYVSTTQGQNAQVLVSRLRQVTISLGQGQNVILHVPPPAVQIRATVLSVAYLSISGHISPNEQSILVHVSEFSESPYRISFEFVTPVGVGELQSLGVVLSNIFQPIIGVSDTNESQVKVIETSRISASKEDYECGIVVPPSS